MTPLPHFLPALPEMFLAASAMALLILGVFQHGHYVAREIAWLSVVVLIATLALITGFSSERQVSLFGMLVTDGFGVFMSALVLIGAAFAIVMAMRFNEHEGVARFEFPVLVLLATTGMLMMISANNLISLYIGLELQNLPLYVIASFQRDQTRSSEAGLKYFVLGALSSGMLLYGASMVYGFAGTTNFDTLAHSLDGSTFSAGLIIGIVFVIVGLAFKVSAVPFHMWTPDVYEGAPTPVTAFFSVAPKIAALALFVRVMVYAFGALIDQWQQIIMAIAVASMILGSFAAINQRNIKRLMAYSSIGHVGYALIGLAAGTPAGVRGILVYMTIYLFMNVGTFGIILTMRRDGKMVENIADLAGLARTRPLLAAVLGIFMFSLAGVPPLAGFFSKFYIFMAAIDARLFWLAVVGVVTSVVGAYYYLRIVKIMYFDEPAPAFDAGIGREMQAVLLIATAVVLLFVVFPAPIISSAELASATLFPG
ncbi:MAG TPA: NADH-quinone oxidoreductase subunit NuoN [Stellaceae bacterium]|jgi:NADH-quinone oxidoreductase subunit N|nr:NADH-quinone oxidoreductase subunit NuoN [Stellaceae bacterium]